MKKLIQLLAVTLLFIYSGIAQQNFDIENDFLLLHNDLSTDPDDIHAMTAVASFLTDADFCRINYFGVVGTNNGGNPNYIPRGDELAQLIYGTENLDWANASASDGDRIATRNLVADLVKPIFDSGGRVWVAEGGQADFTHDVFMRLKDLGVEESKFKTQAIIVQHSTANENASTDAKLDYLRANTDYRKIDDGNLGGNSTPAYASSNSAFIEDAKSITKNPNPTTRSYWALADDIVDQWHQISNHRNDLMRNGGIDFSDASEVWYILGLGNTAWTIQDVMDNYVFRVPSDEPCNPSTLSISFQSPEDMQFEEGIDMGVVVSVDEGIASNIVLFLNDQLVRQENAAPYQWGIAHQNPNVDPQLLNMPVGEYTLRVVATDSRGATATETKIFMVVESTLSINEVEQQKNNVVMHPNPVQNSLFVSGNTSDKLIRIFNVLGEVQITKELKGELNEIDLRALPAGLYLVHMTELSNEKNAGRIYRIVKRKM